MAPRAFRPQRRVPSVLACLQADPPVPISATSTPGSRAVCPSQAPRSLPTPPLRLARPVPQLSLDHDLCEPTRVLPESRRPPHQLGIELQRQSERHSLRRTSGRWTAYRPPARSVMPVRHQIVLYANPRDFRLPVIRAADRGAVASARRARFSVRVTGLNQPRNRRRYPPETDPRSDHPKSALPTSELDPQTA